MSKPSKHKRKKIGDERFRVMAETQRSIEIVGLRGEIKMWCDRPFNEYPDSFLRAYELLLSPIRDKLNWHKNYTQDSFSQITSKTLTSPKTWLTRGKKDVGRSFYLKGSDAKMSCGKYVLHFMYHPDEALYSDSNTPFIRIATPSDQLEECPGEFLDTARQLCDLLPFLCGHVGFCLEISPYFSIEGKRAAFPLAMRHPGIHIETDHATWPLRDEKGVETVNWLTLIGKIPLNKLGGVDRLREDLAGTPDVELIETDNGLIIKAGKKPELGNSNRNDRLPLYRAVYSAIEPVITPVIKDVVPFTLGGNDDVERTQRWFRRFEL